MQVRLPGQSSRPVDLSEWQNRRETAVRPSNLMLLLQLTPRTLDGRAKSDVERQKDQHDAWDIGASTSKVPLDLSSGKTWAGIRSGRASLMFFRPEAEDYSAVSWAITPVQSSRW